MNLIAEVLIVSLAFVAVSFLHDDSCERRARMECEAHVRIATIEAESRLATIQAVKAAAEEEQPKFKPTL